jgi:hypothetical protein
MATMKAKVRIWVLASAFAAITALPALGAPPKGAAPRQWDEASYLSWFGERPAFSPDGKRVAFVGKQFGDAYEVDIATRKVRSLTGHLPHQGIVRVQYLPNGDFLITAPRVYIGPETRFKGTALWVLDRNLQHGLMPLDQLVMEGVAVSSRANRIAFTEFPGANSGTEFYTADVVYEGGVPRLANKRRIVRDVGCMGETQDFRNADREVIFTCYARRQEGQGAQAGVYGVDIASGKVTKYRDRENEYNEVEGIAPDGSWTAVECAGRISKGVPPLDICRLELAPGGSYSVLFKGTQPNSTRKANNPVISPDGKWMAISSSDAAYSVDPHNAGRGDGILLLRLAE